MANGTPNTGNNPAGNVDPKQLTATLKELRQGQGDFQDAIRDSVRELNKVVSSYERIEGTLGALKTSTLNISKIEKELEKAKAKQIVQTNKLKELEDKIGQEGKTRAENLVKSQEYLKKLESDVYKARATGNKQQLAISTNLLATAERYVDQLKQTINPQEAAYAAQLKSLDISDQQVKLAEDYLESEKEVSKAVGNTGKVLGFTSKYLGIGKDLYGKIVEEAREGEFATKKMVTAGGALAAVLLTAYKGMKSLVNAAKDGFDALTSSGGPVSKFFSPFTNLIKQIPFVGGLLGGLVDAFANLADFVTGSSSAIQAFGRNLGLSVDQATKLNNRFSAISQASNNILFNSEKFRKSQTELSEALGVNNIFTDKILMSNIELADLAGLDLETRKELAAVSQITGKDQIQLYKTLLGQNSILSKNLGVNIRVQDAIKQAASLGGVLGLTFAKYPEKLTKSLLTVKSMGLELKQLDSIADSLLDFESSISKEFEAQLLTGKEINLNKAREAFLNNDLVTAAKEITQQVGTSEEFLNLNRFAAESLAASFGMSRDSMADMLKQQEFFAKLQVGDVKKYQEKVSLMSQTIEGQKELVALLGQEEYSRVMNQTATEKVASFIDRIKQSFADLLNNSSFKDFINKALDFISKPANIEGIINKFVGFVSLMVKAIAALLDGLDMLPFVSIDKNIIDSIYKISDDIGSQKISGLMNNPESINVGARAATSQVNATSFGGSTAAASKQQTPITNIINVPKSIIEDHTVSLTARINKSGERDMVTGIMS